MSSGMLAGIRVVEIASESAAFAGKLLAGMGAEVFVIEPPDGHYTRRFGPFAGDIEDPERSLWWWHYNTGKKSVVIDPVEGLSDLESLIAMSDVFLEGSTSGRSRPYAVEYEAIHTRAPHLVWVSVSPFGTNMPRSDEEVTDLTILSSGGPVWSCGYDDHSIPPVRGGGNQGYQLGSIWAVMGALTALSYRHAGGPGQRVDVNMHAAANVTTEMASFEWLVRHETVQRQTGRHAMPTLTSETMVVAKDGRSVNTGMPPRTGPEFRILRDWLQDLGLREGFDDAIFLDIGAQSDMIDLALVGSDAEVTAIFGAGREAIMHIASHLDSYDFFIQAQQRGLTCGVVRAPEEVLDDPQLVARGFPVEVHHEDLGQSFRYTGAPFVGTRSTFEITRSPRIGEHTALVDSLLSSGKESVGTSAETSQMQDEVNGKGAEISASQDDEE